MEFALVAPIFLLTMVGIFSAVFYVFEVQVANDAVQAAARWGVADANFQTVMVGSPPAPEQEPWCIASPGDAPTPMVTVAQAAAGPFAGDITPTTLVTASASGGYGCQVTVTLPYAAFGGLFHVGPTSITATAVDYVS